MPISTDNGKLAIMELDQDYEPGLPLSPGTLGQDDQQQLLWGFPEILWGESEPETEPIPGGKFTRPLWSWLRVFGRSLADWSRVFHRPLHYWERVWRYQPMTTPRIPPKTLVKTASEPRWFAVSFAECPEVQGGETIASPVLLPSSGLGVTISSLSVLDAEFDGIPAGDGVKFLATGGSAGSAYNFAIQVTASGGAGEGKPVVPCRLFVTSDYSSE